MIIDRLNIVSGSVTGFDASGPTAVTGQTDLRTAGTYVSTDSIDLQVARDIGEGRDLYAVATILGTGGPPATGLTGLTSIEVQVVVSANSNLSSPTVIASTGTQTTVAAGTQYVVAVPPLIASAGQRYLGLRYITAGTTATTGSMLAGFVLDLQDGRTFYSRNDNP